MARQLSLSAPSPRSMSVRTPEQSPVDEAEKKERAAHEGREARRELYTRLASERAAQEAAMEELARRQEETEEMLRRRNVTFKAMVKWRRLNEENFRLWRVVLSIRYQMARRVLNTWVSGGTSEYS